MTGREKLDWEEGEKRKEEKKDIDAPDAHRVVRS